ncbi:MAG: peptidoglycan D,D-transpeptidase FtsI family protein, partial [Roseiflexaceae bacterium]
MSYPHDASPTPPRTPRGSDTPRSIVLHPWRLGAAFIIAIVMLARITVQVADVQLLDRAGYVKRASQEIDQTITVAANRGAIRDRNGNLLAVDVERESLYVSPKEVPPSEAARLAVTLGAILAVPTEQVLAKLIDTSRDWAPIARWLKPEVAEKIRILDEPGLHLVYEPRRFYPQGKFAPHIIGATNFNGIGIAGVESSFDGFLRGADGVITAEVDINNNPIWARPYARQDAVDGNELTLTIDAYIQHMVEQELGQAIDQHGASGGSAIVMDVKTGAILAMASFPWFDPNDYAKSEPSVYNNNPAVGAVYEPGSTFKIVTVAAGLQAKAFDENTEVNDTGVIKRYEYTLANYDYNGRGAVRPVDVLYYSSNIGALLFAEMMSESVFYRTVDAFGFGKVTGIELPGETPGIYWRPGTAGYTPINLNTNSFGQGIAVTPLQIVRMAATVANNGVMMRPYIVQTRCVKET